MMIIGSLMLLVSDAASAMNMKSSCQLLTALLIAKYIQFQIGHYPSLPIVDGFVWRKKHPQEGIHGLGPPLNATVLITEDG